jgi:outer membrane murein-binding lipoprotein Lpp
MINFEINTDIDELNVTITDVKGAIVANATFLNGGNASMDVANLSAGVYTLNMKSDELNATQRLVISK